MSNEFPRGRFVWYELMTSDPAAAQSFYTSLIGWGTEAFDGTGTPYTMWTREGTPLGGVMQLPEEAQNGGAPSHWLPYVAVPDVDATVAKAQELGGSVMVPPTDIPEAGRFAVLNDPQSASFCVYCSATDEQGSHDGERQVGEFSWHELVTTDNEAAFSFYSELLGWQTTEIMDMGEIGTYHMFNRGIGPPAGGMFNKTADMPGPPGWLLYVRVENLEQSIEKAKELGGQLLVGPIEVPGGDHIAQFLDPQGAAFALHCASGAES